MKLETIQSPRPNKFTGLIYYHQTTTRLPTIDIDTIIDEVGSKNPADAAQFISTEAVALVGKQIYIVTNL